MATSPAKTILQGRGDLRVASQAGGDVADLETRLYFQHLRRIKRLSEKEVAAALGLCTATLAELERGETLSTTEFDLLWERVLQALPDRSGNRTLRRRVGVVLAVAASVLVLLLFFYNCAAIFADSLPPAPGERVETNGGR